MMQRESLLAGVELGGTKCVCILATGPDDIRKQAVVPTTEPDATLAAIERALAYWSAHHGPIAALGIASFGPVDLRLQSPTYGFIRATAKPGWTDTDVRGRLARVLAVPVGFSTDVNGAALAEHRWGDAQGIDDLAYVTVGTGVGAGLIVGGNPVQGSGHPELGHLRIARLPGDAWPGSCPYHGDCVEGLASGPAIAARTGLAAGELPPDHSAWGPVAFALSQLLHALIVTIAPGRILLGGGVLTGQPHLLQRIRREVRRSLNGYVDPAEADPGLLRYIVPPGLGALAGPMGAIALAAGAVAAARDRVRSQYE
jgi:fructokinase